ncbi:MAG TPA: acyl-CoA dehydrogenase [Alphaproteobacteria bacterium]|nr:acyl-CoA dehydrogenase [Alphaproteobacteria bacterium]
MTYAAPVKDMQFVLEHVAGLDQIARLPGGDAADPDLVRQILAEASVFAADELAPLNARGDQEGSTLENGVVRTPQGWREAYRKYVDGGWNGVPFDPEYGGQGVPWLVATAVQEMWQSANMSFGLCPLLNQGAVELLTAHGSAEQKRTYLPKMVSGDLTGTMNLTEPQAGSDVGALRTRAVAENGHYRIKGQKIFITYGEHDLTENIVHMVLARTPDAPAGSRGISLFIVPKFLLGPNGRPKERNDLRCVSLEHKLGIHASPTAVMAYGDNDGAIGFLVGEENRGLEYMFTMMNNARLNVGLQGVAIAERAYQQAASYARNRVQGREIGAAGKAGAVPIIRHPDVRRMLLTMKAATEAARALTYYAFASLDLAKRHPDAAERARHQARVDLLTPVAKAWCTDLGVDVASTGIQVHGGMGFIEETGAAQHLRDARIAPIYEGTNGIQAADLVSRKIGRDGGEAARAFLSELDVLAPALASAPGEQLPAIGRRLTDGTAALRAATDSIAAQQARRPAAAAGAAVPYLRLFGCVTGGFLMAKAALAASRALESDSGDSAFLRGKVATARFYADHVLSLAPALLAPIIDGSDSILDFAEEQL